MNAGAKEQKYSKIRRRINILGFTVFIGVAAASILTTTQVFNAAWTEWWVGVGGLLVGFAVALVQFQA
jgi:hypothetical protein